MTDRTEEQIARDKAAVDAMRNAKSNMDAALARITTLEGALKYARDNLTAAKQWVSPNCYTYTGSGRDQRTVHAFVDEAVAHATKALG